MTIEQLKTQLPESAKDIKLNLSAVMTEEGAPDLNQIQIYLIALASAHATKNWQLIAAITNEEKLTADEIVAAKSAATIMAMNNIYYRFMHLVEDNELAKLPAKLRMNIIGNPGIDKLNFELCCLAVSAINGCGMCMNSHTKILLKGGITRLGIQSTIRIAAVLNAVALGITLA